ncbi:MAG: glycosyltransferase family 9 protein [Alphaproteobacteria bacterium]
MSGLLFVTATRIGDAILSTGVLGRFTACWPDAPVTVACGPVAAPLFAHLPGLERVHVMAKRPRGGHWLDLWRAAVGRRWDAVVDLRGSVLAWLLAARTRRVRRRWRLADDRHRVVELAAAFGFAPPPAPRLWLGEADRAAAQRLLPPGDPVLAIGPTANWAGKEWRAERFAELARRLTSPGGPLPGARVAVLAAAAERGRAQPVLDALAPDRRIDLVGEDLLTAAACLERAALFVGNDTGLMHLAAAAGAPTLGLFGPSDERHYAPWGERTAVVRTPQSAAALVGTPGFDHRTTGTLMDGLSVESVEAAATALARRPAGAAA